MVAIGLYLFEIKTSANRDKLQGHISQVNVLFVILLALLSCMVRCSHVACWFVSPLLTCISFFYFAFLEYEPDNVSQVFTVISCISVSYFIAVIFSEVWLISTAVYLPLIAFYMAELGDGFIAESTDNSELITRSFFAIFLYAIVTYTAESYSKRAFVGSLTEDILFKRWLHIFETFPEGLAFVRNN